MLEDLIKERLKKRDAFIAAGHDPYPARISRTHTVSEVLGKFDLLNKSGKAVTVAGRITGKRGHGGIFFLDVQDESDSMQAVFKKEDVKDFALFQENLDIGDFVSISGRVFDTKSGEPSIAVKKIVLAAKALRPIPSEWYGITDTETRLRARYLELLVNPEVKEIFRKKARFWNSFRNQLIKNDFLEVETPVLENTPGGADAEPFVTHHNALDVDLYLRISLELPQKKLLVGGYEKIFELGRIFRNEGISNEHLQDYTQLEFYWAYADYEKLMAFVEKLYQKVIADTIGGLKSVWQGKEIDWGGKWPRLEYYDLFKKLVGLDLEKATKEDLLKEARRRKMDAAAGLGRGRLIDLLYKKIVRPTLISPSFLIHPPVEVEPLAKRAVNLPGRVERVQVVACGTELGKGFSEGNDPADQRARFEEQVKLREAGDKEAQRLDEDFLEALEHGMPPAAGFGLSERLFAILMDKPVRETIFFPIMRPK
jgi:lysyl-tRNA synthetase class 2